MGYEIDFIGVSEEKSKQDADAIVFRWLENEKYKVVVYDGGLQAHGEEMDSHLQNYYFSDGSNTIDAVIVSHSDQDHTSGLINILENYAVKALYMNRPWIYVDELFDKVNDRRKTKNSLAEELKSKYAFVARLEEVANNQGIPIYEVFQGEIIEGRLTVLSPSRELYLDLLVESEKTPFTENNVSGYVESFAQKVSDYIKSKLEKWNIETLREDVVTSPENEMSAVIFGEMDKEGFLLVGDAGIRGLNAAMDYADSIGKHLIEKVSILQIPHHGGRHNVSPSVLNRLLGNIIPENDTESENKTAFVSAAENSDHPLQMVVNAYIRRGVKVYKTNGKTICHHNGNMPTRKGWGTCVKEKFDSIVEEWD